MILFVYWAYTNNFVSNRLPIHRPPLNHCNEWRYDDQSTNNSNSSPHHITMLGMLLHLELLQLSTFFLKYTSLLLELFGAASNMTLCNLVPRSPSAVAARAQTTLGPKEPRPPSTMACSEEVPLWLRVWRETPLHIPGAYPWNCKRSKMTK
jgi:hypothetical protein